MRALDEIDAQHFALAGQESLHAEQFVVEARSDALIICNSHDFDQCFAQNTS